MVVAADGCLLVAAWPAAPATHDGHTRPCAAATPTQGAQLAPPGHITCAGASMHAPQAPGGTNTPCRVTGCSGTRPARVQAARVRHHHHAHSTTARLVARNCRRRFRSNARARRVPWMAASAGGGVAQGCFCAHLPPLAAQLQRCLRPSATCCAPPLRARAPPPPRRYCCCLLTLLLLAGAPPVGACRGGRRPAHTPHVRRLPALQAPVSKMGAPECPQHTGPTGVIFPCLPQASGCLAAAAALQQQRRRRRRGRPLPWGRQAAALQRGWRCCSGARLCCRAWRVWCARTGRRWLC
jgi:hypothetical protein